MAQQSDSLHYIAASLEQRDGRAYGISSLVAKPFSSSHYTVDNIARPRLLRTRNVGWVDPYVNFSLSDSFHPR
eukprot:scaffold1162_cov170-Amphora_coffeaeformis.AAC.4